MQPTLTPSAPRRATLDDVARSVGVSKMTVSRVLNGKRKSSPHEAAILKAVEELDFEPNALAQQLSQGGQSNVIALFTSVPDLGVGTMTLRHIQGTMFRRGYHVALHSSGFSGSLGTDEVIDRDVLQSLRRSRPRAIICSVGAVQTAAMDEIQRFQDEGGLVVAYGMGGASERPECDCVLFDIADSARQAVEYLLVKGHRAVGFCHHGHDKPSDPRLVAIREVLEQRGLELPETWVFSGDIYEANGARLAESYLALEVRPTALIIVNDVSAATFVHQMQRAGRQVPCDVSVVGQDDVPAARFCVVPLTTVTQPVELIAEQVCDLLLDRLENRYTGPERTVNIKGKLIERESVAVLSREQAC